MSEQINSMLESFRIFWDQLLHFLPQLVIGILLMVVGWLIAKLLRKIVVKLLKLVRLDVAAEKAGIDNLLIKVLYLLLRSTNLLRILKTGNCMYGESL